jgi:type I restriction enzyme S subunit
MGVDMATTQDFVNWICGPLLLPEYLLYVLRSMISEFKRLTMGSTHMTIYMPDVGRFVTPLPPLGEQKAIVAFIRRETRALDALVDSARAAVILLGEYRRAIISAAVTGKIDVRGEVDMEELES